MSIFPNDLRWYVASRHQSRDPQDVFWTGSSVEEEAQRIEEMLKGVFVTDLQETFDAITGDNDMPTHSKAHGTFEWKDRPSSGDEFTPGKVAKAGTVRWTFKATFPERELTVPLDEFEKLMKTLPKGFEESFESTYDRRVKAQLKADPSTKIKVHVGGGQVVVEGTAQFHMTITAPSERQIREDAEDY